MSREWKPGDVALIVGDSAVRGQRAMRCDDMHGARIGWSVAGTDGLSMAFGPKDLRPLVVIDPEDPKQVERLTKALIRTEDMQRSATVNTQAALRSLLAPPKPPEPTGLGAVVEDAEGVPWVRYKSAERKPWRANYPGPVTERKPWRANYPGLVTERIAWWRDIDAVKILSPGWSE